MCYHDQKETLSTGLIEFLQCNGITTVIVGGVATDYCVKVSVLQLCKAGFDVVLNRSACRGVAEDTIQQALHEMAQAGARFVDSAFHITCA